MMNIFSKLLAPTNKLAEFAEEQLEEAKALNVITLDIRDEAVISNEELKKQTILLTDIKTLIKEQIDSGNSGGSSTEFGDASKFKGLAPDKATQMAGIAIGSMVAITVAAALIQYTPIISIGQLLTVIAVAGALALVVPAFLDIATQLSGSESSLAMEGDGAFKASSKSGPGLAGVGVATLALVGMSVTILLTSFIFSMIMPLTPANAISALVIAAILIPMAFAFSLITKELAKAIGQKSAGFEGMEVSATDSSGLAPLAGAGLLSLLGMAFVITVSSWVFSLIMPLSMPQALTAILISLTMVGLALSIGKILVALKDAKIKPNAKGVKNVLMAGMAMVVGVIALVAASAALQLLQPITMQQFIGMLAIGIGLIPLAFSFGMIIKALGDAGVSGMKGVGLVMIAGLAMIAIGGAILGISYVFQLLPDTYKAPPLLWSLIVGLSMVAFAWSFSTIMKAVKGASLKEIAFGTIATVLVAVAILGAAYVFTLFPEETRAPGWKWSLQTGLALLMFALPFTLITILFKSMSVGIKEIGMGTLGLIAVALGIMVTAHIFAYLPDDIPEESPFSFAWILGAAGAIFFFAIPVAAIGLIATSGVGAMGIVLGVVGMIVIAAGILAVAWIFSALPDLGEIGKNITNLILAPINGIVDVLARLKKEVGVGNLLPLAGGIAAISLSLLLLAGATAGIAAGGVVAAIGSAVKGLVDGIASFFGGEKSKGPLDILDDLIKKRNKIAQLAKPLGTVAAALEGIILAGNAVKTINKFLQTLITMSSNYGGSSLIDTAANGLVRVGNAFMGVRSAMIGFTTKPLHVLAKLFKMRKMIGVTAKHMAHLAISFASFATQAYIAGRGLKLISDAFVRMTNVDEARIKPVVDFMKQLTADTYIPQSMAFMTMAKAIVKIAPVAELVGDALSTIAGAYYEIVSQNPSRIIPVMMFLKQLGAHTYIPQSVAIASMSKSFTKMSLVATLVGRELNNIAKAYLLMTSVEPERIVPVMTLLKQLTVDTYMQQAMAFRMMAPAVVSILGGGDNQGFFDKLFGRKEEDHPFVKIMYAMHACADKIVLLALPLVSVAASFTQIATQPLKKVTAATRMFKTLSESSFDKQARALKSVATSVERIADGSNNMNIEAIDSSTKMFKALAYLSATGKDNAIADLGNALVDAIGELGDIMAEFGNTVSDGMGDSRNIVERGLDYITGDSAPRRSAPRPAPVNLKPVVNAIRDLESKLSDDGIKIKKI